MNNINKNIKKRKMIWLKSIFLISLILSSSIFVGCSKLDTGERRKKSKRKGDEVTLYAACDSGYDTVTAMFMRDFAERVEKKSNGRIHIETYSDSQVGGDTELLESCQNGNISFVFQTTAPQVSLIPQLAILDSPMAFKNKEIARNLLDGKLLDILKPYYKKKNIEILGFADQGFREMTSNKKIKGIDDFRAVKIRTMENPYHILFWKSLGANPTPMAYAEVYIGLQQGTIDAQENPLESIIAPRFYEQQDYMIMTNHLLHSVTCIASTKVIDALDKNEKEIIYSSIDESKKWARNKTDERFKEKMKIVEKSGTKIVNLDEKTIGKIKEKSKIVRDKIEKNVGKELMNSFKNAIKNVENKY